MTGKMTSKMTGKMKHFLILTFIVSCFALGGCDVFLDEPITCNDAISHTYSSEANCIWADGDGNAMSEWDAVEACETQLEYAKDFKCDEVFYDKLDCMTQVQEGQCEGCNHLHEAFVECLELNYYGE